MIEELQLEFHSFATRAGFLVMKSMMDAEEKYLAGERDSHGTDINRWGSQPGSVIVGGQKVKFHRTRLRTGSGQEVRIKSYDCFHNNDSRSQGIYERMLAGVSCRDYKKTVESVRDGYGRSKLVVGKEVVQATAKDLALLCELDLSSLDIWVLIIDGVEVGGTTQIVALGVDFNGKKQFLGFREVSTENARVCLDLLHGLRHRGLSDEHPIIVIIDGSRALQSSVEKFFGQNACVQRCQQHKRLNIPSVLRKSFSTTNLIESPFSHTRKVMKDV